MNNAASRQTAKITNSRALSLLEQLIAAAEGAALPAPLPACTELAEGGAHCTGAGATLSTYTAPAETHWILNAAGEDFEVSRTYTRRCA